MTLLNYSDYSCEYIIEPLLLTSLLLLPISVMYYKKKYFVLSFLIFINGIASYIYHFKKDHYSIKEDKNNGIIFDVITTCLSFILSLYAAKNLSTTNKYNLCVIVLFAIIFYSLNYWYKSYNYHLLWHIFVLLGQSFLVSKI